MADYSEYSVTQHPRSDTKRNRGTSAQSSAQPTGQAAEIAARIYVIVLAILALFVILSTCDRETEPDYSVSDYYAYVQENLPDIPEIPEIPEDLQELLDKYSQP